jgi:hypothetical protein
MHLGQARVERLITQIVIVNGQSDSGLVEKIGQELLCGANLIR